MEIFKELTIKGYKHYYEGTIEELDSMDKNNQNLHSEIMQVIMWFYEKHGIWIWVESSMTAFTDNKSHSAYNSLRQFNSPTEAYEAAILYTLNNLI